MKIPSDALFSLIKSLDGEEKRQFKLFFQQKNNQSAYLQLFDAIDSLKIYDEKKLLLILTQKGWNHTIKVVKRYLQESLYRFLEYHYFDHSVEIQLQRFLQRIEILYVKRLFLQAEKFVFKAEKLAVAHQQYLYLLNILSWKRKIMIQLEDVAGFEAYDEHYLCQIQSVELFRNIIEYEKIFVRVIRFSISKLENLDKKTIAELKKILEIPILKNEEMALSFPAKIIYCRILGDIHLMLKNKEESYKFLQRVSYYSEQAMLSPAERLRAFINLTVLLVQLEKNEELLLIKEKASELIRSVPTKMQTISLHNQYFVLMNNCISYQIRTTKVDEALLASDEIMNLMEKRASTSTFLVYFGNLSIIYFLKADYRQALYYTNEVLSMENKGIRTDIISFLKILNIVIHYELGNEEIIPGLCYSVSGYFNKQEQAHVVERIMINFFDKKICKIKTKIEKINTFSGLKMELDSYRSEEIFNHFDFISWAESKIENRYMVNIIREKAEKRIV